MIETTNRPTSAPTDREIVVTRDFDAPRDLVFEASTNPLHVPRWWICDAMTMPVCEINLRPGGAFRFVMRDADGTEYPMKGVYREVVRPERIVHTQILDVEPYADREALVTVTFEDWDGQTRLTSRICFSTPEDRAGAAATGMKSGMAIALDRLAEVVRTIA